jgi:hypothetical protein
MTNHHSPIPWTYEYNPYTLQRGDAAAEELPAFEIFDAEQNKIFETNEDMPCEIQEANARLASAAPELLEACRLVVARWEQGDLAEAARSCQAAIAEATPVCPPSEAGHPYSVLLLYPNYANDSGTETYYAFVHAADASAAVVAAKRKAVAVQEGIEIEPDDFIPLIVTPGHHNSEPLFNK